MIYTIIDYMDLGYLKTTQLFFGCDNPQWDQVSLLRQHKSRSSLNDKRRQRRLHRCPVLTFDPDKRPILLYVGLAILKPAAQNNYQWAGH